LAPIGEMFLTTLVARLGVHSSGLAFSSHSAAAINQGLALGRQCPYKLLAAAELGSLISSQCPAQAR